jgi:hypothetical protein
MYLVIEFFFNSNKPSLEPATGGGDRERDQGVQVWL